MSKDAAQGYVHQSARIIGLCAHVEYGHNHTDEDEEERAIDSSRYANVHWESNVVERCATRVEKDDDAAESCAYEGCDDDGLPCESDGV